MNLRTTVERSLLSTMLGLPEPVQRRLAGPPVVIDGQRLATDTQLLLRLQKLSGKKGAETMPVPEGRVALKEHTALPGGDQPIGQVRDLVAAGLPARLYTPEALTTDRQSPLLVFFHGGGFMYGDLDTHDAPCRFLAERAGVKVLAIDYRLAPEHPFPAAFDDSVAAFEWAAEHAADLGCDPERIAVGGDSAGGNLAAVVAIEAARASLPCVFQLLVYPCTDCTRPGASPRLFGEGFYLTKAFMDLANDCYLGTATDPRDPRVSPLFADLPEGLAPAFVATAGFDPLRDEGEEYAAKLAAAGVPVEVKRYADQIHGFFNVVGVGRTSRAAVGEIAAKLKAALH